MSPTLILSLIGVGFVVALGGIILIIVISTSNKNKNKSKKKTKKTIKIEDNKDETFDIDDLLDMVKDQNISNNDLMNLLIYFNTNITLNENNAKKGLLFFSRALTHQNKDKNIFQYFHREVKPKNTKFINELNRIEKRALS